MLPQESPWPPIKIGGEWELQGQGPHLELERRVAYGLMHVPANALAQDGVTLTEFRILPVDDGWLAILKGTRRSKKLVAFVHAPTWREALRTTTTLLDSRHLSWRLEKPPPWER